MRILLASRNFFPKGVIGGGQMSVNLLGQELAKQEHDVAVLSVDDKANTGIHEESGLYEYRVKLRNLYTNGNHPSWKKALWHGVDRFTNAMEHEYRKVLEDFKPDVINTNVLAGMGLGIWRAAEKLKIPVIHTVHDYYLLCQKSGMRRNNVNCQKVCSSCRFAALKRSLPVVPAVSEVIYVSTHMQRAHESNGLFLAPTTQNSIIVGSYEAPEPLKIRTGRIDPDRVTYGYLGRISPEKGVDRLIDSLSRLPEGTWKLIVGGGGDADYVAGVKKKAEGLPVEFLGWTDAVSFFRKVDAVFIYSLWNEPGARVTYESGLNGAVPIVADRGGLPEIAGFGSRGLVFEPEDEESLFAAVEQLNSNQELVTTFGQAWSEIVEEYNPRNVAHRTLDVYQRAIDRSSNLLKASA